MITYSLWKSFIEDFTVDTSNFAKAGAYAICSFLSIWSIILDIVSSPFQLIGLAILIIQKGEKMREIKFGGKKK